MPTSLTQSLQRAAHIAVSAVSTHRLRTSTAMLGVAAGTAALVAVLALGDGLERAARSEVERTTDFQTVTVSAITQHLVDGMMVPTRGYPIFDADAAADAGRTIGDVRYATLMTTGGVVIAAPDRGARAGMLVSATSANADAFMRIDVAAGRFFTSVEDRMRKRVIVLSSLAARHLAAGQQPETLVGAMVRIGSEPFEVIGVLAGFPGEREMRAFVPSSSGARVFGETIPRPAPVLLLAASSIESVETVRRAAGDWVADRYGQRRELVALRTATDRLAQTRRAVRLFKLFVGALACISIFVGGIGIMNVLLAAVTERTREIGIRRAAGAARRDIMLQFFAESAAITGFGSVAGVTWGVAIALTAGAVFRRAASNVFVDITVAPDTLFVAALVPVIVGLLFGIYPAHRASTLSPIDAIRHES